MGVAVGVSALLIVVSVMSGFHKVIRDRLLGLEPHIVVTLPARVSEFELGRKILQIEQITAKFDPLAVTRVQSQEVILRSLDGTFSSGLARGYSSADMKSFLARVRQLNTRALQREEAAHVVAGDEDSLTGAFTPALSDDEVPVKERQVILGIDLARNLRVLEGDQILLIPPESLLLPKGEVPVYERVTVAGRVSTRVAEVDSKLILFNVQSTLTKLRNSPSREGLVEIRLRDSSLSETLQAELKRELPTLQIDSWRDRNQALFFALKMEKLVMTAFLGLSGLITSFSVVAVLSLLISQKRREIGLLMAMGLSRNQVQRLFVAMGFLLSAFGVAGGLVFGLLTCAFIDRFPISLLPDIYYDSTIPVLVTVPVVLAILTGAFLLAVISAFLPSRGLSRLTPAETFRLRGT